MALSFARKAAIVAVPVAAFGGTSFGASAIAVTSGPTAHPASAPVSVVAKRSASAHQQVPQVVTQVIGKGRMDGHRWSVVLAFHRTLPTDYTLPTLPNETTAPGTSLHCRRMFIGGVRIDHQGGPWTRLPPAEASSIIARR
ncbi:hypothetical protein ACFY2M_45330 [Streptomyces sp. NPDC001276]|uniref:hypothetical protein n=1 Tax=Streptomyces sp. NPDC001276 TaxID=3364555 RepID=UPI00367D343E